MLVMKGFLILLCAQHYSCDHILNANDMNITTHLNSDLASGTCYKSILHTSYYDCFNELQNNVYGLNVLVYIRRYLLCNLCLVTETLDLKETPGSIVANKPITGTLDENIAFGKPAYQIKVYYHEINGFANASLAVDGIWESNMVLNSKFTCAQIGSGGTNSSSAWWMVDFEKIFPISRLEILVRSDCCAERFSNILVEIGETIGNMRLCAEYQGPGSLGEIVNITCQPPRLGRFVRLRKLGAAVAFEICEVAVYR